MWRRHFIWDFSTSSACHSSVKNLNKLDFVHIKRECDVLCFWSMNYLCTFSNLQKEWINLTEFQQNYRYISKHAYFTFLNKIMPFEKKYGCFARSYFTDIIASNESLDVPVTKSRNTKLLQICGSTEIWCKSSVYSGEFRVSNLEHLRDSCVIARCRQMLGFVQIELARQALYIYRDCMQDYDSFKYKEYVVGWHITPSVWHLQKQIR